MNKKLYKDIIIIFLVIIISTALIFKAVDYFSIRTSDYNNGHSFSIKTEKSLGKLVKKQILIDANISKAPITIESLIVMKDYLVNSSDYNFDVDIILVNSNTINAISLPGGTIIIYSGLIKAANDPKEVMAVIAHELGHLHYRDSYNSVLRSFGISILLSAISVGDNEIITDIINNLISLKFSRDIESRADDYAIKLLSDKGVDPKFLGSFFEELEKLNDSKSDETLTLNYLTTHPSPKDRILKSKKASVNYYSNKVVPEFDWQKIKNEQQTFF